MHSQNIKTYQDIIIGAGVSGLSYAGFIPHDDYLILEKEPEIGGYCRTIKRDGFVWDYSGHFFHFRDSEIEKCIRQGMDPDTLRSVNKQTQIRYKDRYVDFPFQKNIHQLEKSELVDCLYDFYFREKKEWSTFKEMLYGKLGRAISEKFLIPYNEKLYACDLNTLDHRAMDRFFPEVALEGIIRNFKTPDNPSYNATFTYSSGGAVEYIHSLSQRVREDRIRTSEEVVGINLQRKVITTTKSEYGFKHLVSSIPLVRLMELCDLHYDPSIYSWNQVLVFNLGFDGKGRDIKNHWIYFPEDKYVFYRVGYYDNILNQDRMSLYVEIGFPKDAHINVDASFRRVMTDLKKAGTVTDQRLVDYHSVIMDPAYVHIRPESMDDVPKKLSDLHRKYVYSIGRYGGWKYCSIEDNIIEAKNLADSLYDT